MVITQVQAFLAILAAGGAIGARRGWHREVISSAVILRPLLFFVNGGDLLLANLFTNGVSGGLAGGAADPPASTAACTIGLQSAVITKVGFPVMALMGYRTAYRYGPPPTMTHHRITGMIPGLVNGAAIAYYISHYILSWHASVGEHAQRLHHHVLPAGGARSRTGRAAGHPVHCRADARREEVIVTT